jgi:hypothetical protein
MPNKNYYEVLDVPSDASPQAIKEQYRFLLHAWHPDKFPNPQQKLRAQERTKEINEAYEILSDPQKRRQYDKFLFDHATQTNSTNAQRPTPNASAQAPTEQERRRAEYVRQRQQEAEAERQRVEEERQQYVREQAERLRAEAQEREFQGTRVPFGFPVACQKCGRSDASLRWSAFPYVISIVILTFRRGWGGLFCGQCRRREMFKAKLLTLFLGWWGVPWGVFYTLGVLFKSDNGDVPADVNADYLKALGAYFLQSGQIGEALLTFNSSLHLRRDSQLEQLVKDLFGETSISSVPTTRGGGIGFTPVMLGVAAIILVIFFMAPSFSTSNVISSPDSDKTRTQISLVTRQPTVTRTPTRSPATPTATLPPPQDWRLYNSEQAAFSAYIPSKWAGDNYPPTADNPMRGVAFFPSATLRGEDATTISVMSVPMVDFAGAQAMSVFDLKRSATDWLADRQLKTIQPPTETEIAGYVAVWMVHEAELQDKEYKLRAYAAMIPTPKWFYYIEVAGLADYDDVIHNYFDEFIKHFQPSQR